MAVVAAGDRQAGGGRCPAQSGLVVAVNCGQVRLAAFSQRWRWPQHMFLLRAGRSQPGTAHGGPPNTGSRGSKVSIPARNSGRTAAISFSSSPAGAWYCPASAASARSPAVLLVVEDGRGDADRDAAADTAGVQVNGRPARGRGLGDIVQPQCLPPFPNRPRLPAAG